MVACSNLGSRQVRSKNKGHYWQRICNFHKGRMERETERREEGSERQMSRE